MTQQGIDKVIEVTHKNRCASTIQIDILQPRQINPIAHPNGGDINTVAVDEVIPGSGSPIIQGIATSTRLFIRVAVTNKEHLVACARNRHVSRHSFLNAVSEVSTAAERTIGNDAVDLCIKGGQGGHWRVRH